MANYASARFWTLYESLLHSVRERADKNYERFKASPDHPSLHFKRVGKFYSARVGREYRVLAIPVDDGLLRVWIGLHDEYERLILRT
jgi:hypothetical protein